MGWDSLRERTTRLHVLDIRLEDKNQEDNLRRRFQRNARVEDVLLDNFKTDASQIQTAFLPPANSVMVLIDRWLLQSSITS